MTVRELNLKFSMLAAHVGFAVLCTFHQGLWLLETLISYALMNAFLWAALREASPISAPPLRPMGDLRRHGAPAE